MARVRPGEAANPAPPTVARVRLRFAKRGRLRFLSHRDVARSFERALRRAGVPVAYSHGFSPHPRLSWVGAVPTGAASEAEYVEIGLIRPVDPAELARALDAALPDGLDVLAAAPAEGAALAERIDAGRWRVELAGVDPQLLRVAVAALLARDTVVVHRITPSGRREVDVRAALAALSVEPADREPGGGVQPGPIGTEPAEVDRSGKAGACTGGAGARTGVTSTTVGTGLAGCAILTAVVRQTTPAVRPDDVLGALDVVAGLRLPVPARATRTAQGLLDDRGALADPLGHARVTTRA